VIVVDFVRQWKFSLLLAALLTNILLAPLFGNVTASIAFTMLLILIAFVLGNNRKVIFSYTILACAALIFSWIHLSNYSNHTNAILTHLFSFLAQTFAIALIIKNVFSSETVSIDTIASSLCAYLLLGFAFASIYAFIDIVEPNAFMSSIKREIIVFSQAQSSLDRVYFSFITLLTVGYGDIVPNSPAAKLTTIIEGFLGQIYIVVLIARLVGMHVSQRNNHLK